MTKQKNWRFTLSALLDFIKTAFKIKDGKVNFLFFHSSLIIKNRLLFTIKERTERKIKESFLFPPIFSFIFNKNSQ